MCLDDRVHKHGDMRLWSWRCQVVCGQQRAVAASMDTLYLRQFLSMCRFLSRYFLFPFLLRFHCLYLYLRLCPSLIPTTHTTRTCQHDCSIIYPLRGGEAFVPWGNYAMLWSVATHLDRQQSVLVLGHYIWTCVPTTCCVMHRYENIK